MHNAYDRIVYLNIFKKDINIFSKKGFLRGGQNVAKGGGHKKFSHPPTQMPSYAPDLISNFEQNLLEDCYQQNQCLNSNTCLQKNRRKQRRFYKEEKI